MRCVISSGCRYVKLQDANIPVLERQCSFVTINGFASSFCKDDAEKYIEKFPDKEKWIARFLVNSKNRYIITDVSLFVQDLDGATTPNHHKAYIFDTVAQAQVFLRKHKVFDNAYILNTNLCLIEKKNKSETQCKRIAFSAEVKNKVYRRYNGRCGICGSQVDSENFTIDHILPLSRGGKNELSNYQLACTKCNALKSNYTDTEFARSITKILANQFEHQNQSELSDMIIQSIVRGKINDIRKDYR